MRSIPLFALALVLFASSAFAQSAQHVRGDIVSIEGTKLTIRTRTGDTVPIELADNYKVVAVVPAPRDAIRTGAFVGTAAMPQSDGTQRALEVLVFPESGRGSGEGHYPWDLRPGSTMTNATVAEVTKVDQDQRLTLKYKDGEKTIVVPRDAPVVTFEPGSREMLRAGAHVLVNARPKADGALTAASVLVGKDGLVPPM
ncbi:MAG TPA: hypothetical protein VN858_09065 [Casimicrobiaceae bacterium]|jgi:hypothetical protein|nr:hypothetical protein [Casimicrobiaceae bacterium]HXU67175.1 hypothetical protein [Casimicrobiaceae bacterium]